MIEFALQRKVKILCTVRDIVDIISSFEKLYRAYAHIWQFPQEKHHIYKWQTAEDRADLWMANDQPIGISYNRLREAMVNRGFADRIHVVEFEELTSKPAVAMKRIYDFLEEEYFFHDFNNIEQTTHEDDKVHGIPGLHDIRSSISPVISDAKKILPADTFTKYLDAQFWR